MAITVISRPVGHKLTTVDISAQIIDSGTDTALVYTTSAHGLVDGDYVYIESNFDSYNGFKYVDSIAYDSFKIKESEGGDYVPFKQTAAITFRISVLDHGWQCVHLPIVYELQSNIFPSNNPNTPRTVTSFTNENGYTNLNLSGGLLDTPTLSYIVITGAANDSLNGVFQIINQVSVSDVTIDLAYDSGYSFIGATVIKYYQGYFMSVKVYGGLEIDHPWYTEKPMELLATLKFTPDSFNNIKFSISEILKGQITLRNNLTLDTLPNNIDFYTSFYITYTENYDTSDGTTITLYTGSETIDTFTGYATNSILPFKSENIGHLSDYVNDGAYLARWLTTQDRPVAIVDRFFDLSFINIRSGDITIKHNGVDYLTLVSPGKGILRIPITGFAVGEHCFVAFIDPYTIVTANLNGGSNIAGAGSDWIVDSTPSTTLANTAGAVSSDYYALPYSFEVGNNYILTFGLEYQFLYAESLSGAFDFYILNASNVSIELIGTYNIPSPVFYGTATKVVSFIAPAGGVKIGVKGTGVNGSPGPLTGLFLGLTSLIIEGSTGVEPYAITESICIDVIEECSGTFVYDNLRLTEGGIFRELE